MNAYWIDAGPIRIDWDYETGYEEISQACGVYFGVTRGKAKQEFLNEYYQLEYIYPMRIRLLQKNIKEVQGGLEIAQVMQDYELWNKVDKIIKKEGYYKP